MNVTITIKADVEQGLGNPGASKLELLEAEIRLACLKYAKDVHIDVRGDTEPGYVTVSELMKNAKPCSLFKDVQEEITKQANSQESQAAEARRMAGIAEIMNKVVGAEE